MSGRHAGPGRSTTGPDRPLTSAGDPSRLLVLLRHGQSTWNAENRFTGWTDVDLSDIGVAEAHRAARLLHEHGVGFDVCFSSAAKWAIRTLWIIQDDLDRMWVPVHLSWRGRTSATTARSRAWIRRRPPQGWTASRCNAGVAATGAGHPRSRRAIRAAVMMTRATRRWRPRTCLGLNCSRIPSPGSCLSGRHRSCPGWLPAIGYSSSRTATACEHW